MRIKDRPEYKTKPKPLSCTPDVTIAEAARRMASEQYGSIVVVNDDDTVAGILTERDILNKVVATDTDIHAKTVRDVMTSKVRTASEDENLLDWLRIMSNERFRRVPIVDKDGRLVSLMTQGDFVSYTWPQLIEQATTLAKGTLGRFYPVALILSSFVIYTLALVFGLAILR